MFRRWIADDGSRKTVVVDLAAIPHFSLGDLQVEPALRRMSCRGEAWKVEPRVLQVLIALAERDGEVVSRTDLLNRCWGRQVSDDAVQRCVAALRKIGATTNAFAIESIPRVGYRLIVPEEPDSGPRPDRVLLVLPFDLAQSQHTALDAFAEGVSEGVLRALSRLRACKVIARSTAFQFRGDLKKTAGATLGADFVLDGAVWRSGSRIRVTAELSEVKGATVLWSSGIDCEQEEFFLVQDTIAREVAAALAFTFSSAPTAARVDHGIYEHYVRARALLERPSAASTNEAEQLLTDATAASPAIAQLWAALATAHAARRSFLPFDLGVSAAAAARSAAERAIAIDPQNGEAHAVIAATLPDVGDWFEKDTFLERAVRSDPNDVALLERRALFKLSVGYASECVTAHLITARLDPLSPKSQLGGAMGCWLTGRTEEAVARLDAAIARWPEHPWLWFYKYWILVNSDHLDRAHRHLLSQRPSVMDQDFVDRQTFFLEALTRPNAAAEWTMRWRSASVEEIGQYGLQLPQVMARLGEHDAAYQVLDRICVPPWRHMAWGPAPMRIQPGAITVTFFSPASRWLRTDQRFTGVCARLGLVDYWLARTRPPDCASEPGLNYDFMAECAASQARMTSAPPP